MWVFQMVSSSRYISKTNKKIAEQHSNSSDKGFKYLPYLSFLENLVPRRKIWHGSFADIKFGCASAHIYVHHNTMEYLIALEKTEWMKQKPLPTLKHANYNGKSMTGQGMNSASKFASICFVWIASMLITTKSKLRSSATSPMIAVGLLPSPSRSSKL